MSVLCELAGYLQRVGTYTRVCQDTSSAAEEGALKPPSSHGEQPPDLAHAGRERSLNSVHVAPGPEGDPDTPLARMCPLMANLAAGPGHPWRLGVVRAA